MSKQEREEEMPENTITYVYVPDEGIYGTVVSHGAWASMIEYYDMGFKYTIEIDNDDFVVIDEIGIGYLDEKEES